MKKRITNRRGIKEQIPIIDKLFPDQKENLPISQEQRIRREQQDLMDDELLTNNKIISKKQLASIDRYDQEQQNYRIEEVEEENEDETESESRRKRIPLYPPGIEPTTNDWKRFKGLR